MSKSKLFIDNFLVYGLGGIISKAVPFVMVPIVTRLMPDPIYFGLSDLSHTVVSLASSFAVMGMYDAMFRMFFEHAETEYKKTVCSTALMFTMGTSVLVFLILLLMQDMIAQYFFGDTRYAYLVYISAMATLVSATNSIIAAPTRMQNKRRIFLVTNAVSPIIAYSTSIPLLLGGYYVIALPVAGVVAGLSIEIVFWLLNRAWFSWRYFDKALLKTLLRIAVPLVPNFLIYWVFNSSDRVMLTNLLDVGAAGLYAVGAKLGMASQLIYIAFAGGWQYFAFSTMKEKNQVETNSRIFEYLGIVSFAATAFICAWSYPVYDLLFVGEYVGAFIVSPYLFLAPLLQMLFQVAANQFLVVKKTWPNMIILSAGAAVNIFLNFWLIPRYGIEGAGIATLLGYVVSDIVCMLWLMRMGLMRCSLRFVGAVLLMLLYFLIWRTQLVSAPCLATGLSVILAVLYALLYRELVRKAAVLWSSVRHSK